MAPVCLQNFDDGSKNNDGSPKQWKIGQKYTGKCEAECLKAKVIGNPKKKKLDKQIVVQDGSDPETPDTSFEDTGNDDQKTDQDDSKTDQINLDNCSKKDLEALCQEKEIKIPSGAKKADLVELLLENESSVES